VGRARNALALRALCHPLVWDSCMLWRLGVVRDVSPGRESSLEVRTSAALLDPHERRSGSSFIASRRRL